MTFDKPVELRLPFNPAALGEWDQAKIGVAWSDDGQSWVGAALEADAAGEKIPDLEEGGVILDPHAEFIEGR